MSYDGHRHGSPPHHEGPPHHGPHGFHHHPPPHLEHESGGSHGSSNLASAESTVKGDIVKIFSEADTGFNLAVRGNGVVVAEANESDPYQQWIKDISWSNKAKDAAGSPAFALVNKGSGKAMCRPREAAEQVIQTTYHQNSLNEVVLWSAGKDLGHGYHAIRPINDIDLNLDIDHGSKKYGGIKDGKEVILFSWKNEENQHWQMKALGEERHHRMFLR